MRTTRLPDRETNPMPPKTLVCSAKYRYHRMDCYSTAVWAITRKDAVVWYGACHQHSHQVLKRLGEDGAELEVRLATAVIEELRRAHDKQQATSRAEKLADAFRPLVQDSDRILTADRVVDLLAEHGHLSRPATAPEAQEAHLVAGELLEIMCDEGVLEAAGKGQYEPAGPLPYSEPAG